MSIGNSIFGVTASAAINAALITAFASISAPSFAIEYSGDRYGSLAYVPTRSQMFASGCTLRLRGMPAAHLSKIYYREPDFAPNGPYYVSCKAISAAGGLTQVWVRYSDLDQFGKNYSLLLPFAVPGPPNFYDLEL